MIYIKGDATNPQGDGSKIITHCCNDVGKWGAGFVVALSNRYPNVKKSYLNLFDHNKPKLGDVQFVFADKNLIVANIIGQHGIGIDFDGKPPIRYKAIRDGLLKVKQKAIDTGSSCHMPRMGCGLAGGEWSIMEHIIKETLINYGIKVIVYDLP